MALEPRLLRIGTRASRLALWQADHVAALLRAAHPGLVVERVEIVTAGDRVLDQALSRIGDKGLFTHELEDALRTGRIDLAVHSLKDLPTTLPADLDLGAVVEREDPRDALVSNGGRRLDELPAGARIGTSSLRRRSQLLAQRPDLVVLDLRGNVPTRLEKVACGEADATVLARAGLMRLGLDDRIAEVLAPEVMLPAVGQGALGVELRRQDERVTRLLAPLDHAATRLATAAERALLARLEGGCQVPVGALAEIAGGRLRLRGLVADIDGSRVVREETEGVAGDATAAARLGTALAERLLEAGASPILAKIRAAGGGIAGACE
ncbi:MAG: hydroxymethylbilane synthase [Vicinamibacteria bacterium]